MTSCVSARCDAKDALSVAWCVSVCLSVVVAHRLAVIPALGFSMVSVLVCAC